MIYAHEIPSGSRLYFDKSARIKRKIENDSAQILSGSGYHEIVTPLFSYHQHESFDSKQSLVRLNDAANHEVSLRADSTVDVVRIVTKRLGRSSDIKRWFYIQPVFFFPTKEYYQVGAELIDGTIAEACKMSQKLLRAQGIESIVQIANIAIPNLLSQKYGIDIAQIKSMNIDKLLSSEYEWMQKLVRIDSLADLSDLSIYPEDIAKELQKISDLASSLDHEHIVISPLYYAKMRYYDSLIFRFFEDNSVYAMGGEYSVEGVNAAGFAIYTDQCIEKLINKDSNEH